MQSRHSRAGRMRVSMVLPLLALAGLAVVLPWEVPEKQLYLSSERAGRHPSGQPQLTSVYRFTEMSGPLCEWTPASGAASLAETLQAQQASVRGPAPSPTPAEQAAVNARRPVRMIKDSYPSFSSVAVDIANNEVVVTDEATFQILAYDRMENTPPTAAMSEPKRVIGGLNTWVEYQCGLYIDQRTGDIYAVNNDTVDRLVVFSRDQRGNVPPERIIRTPHTTYGIAVDEPHQELFLTTQEGAAVAVFHKMAGEHDAPIRLLQGDKTLLADPHGIAVDSTRNLMFVTNFGSTATRVRVEVPEGQSPPGFESDKPNWPVLRDGAVPGTGRYLPASITVYPRDASGDVAPLRVITGPKTQLNWPTALAVDAKRGDLFVANDTGDSILVFNVTDGGDVAPKRVIKGPRSLVKSPTGVFYDWENDELWVSNFGNHTATVYRPDANGDVPPLRVIRSAPLDVKTPNIGNAFAVAYDTKRDQLLVPNCVSHPQIAIFDRLADGNAAPVRAIAGQRALLARTAHGIDYDPVRDEFMITNFYAQSVQIYRGDADGEAAPVRIIQGPKTMLKNPDKVMIDHVNDEIYVPEDDKVLVFPGNANGDVAPKRVLKPQGLSAAILDIDAVHNLLVVGGGGGRAGSKFQIFDRTASGDTQPLRVIQGPNSGLQRLQAPLVVQPSRALIIAGVRTLEELGGPDNFVGVWDAMKGGDVPPLYKLGGPNGLLQQVRGVTLNFKHKELIVSDKRINGVMTYYFPEIF